MISLLAPLGQLLDKSRLDASGKPWFQVIVRHHKKALGALGALLLVLLILIVMESWVWWAGSHPPPGRFFLADVAHQQNKAVWEQGAPNTQMTMGSPTSNIIELNTSLTPRMSTSRVKDWTKRALMQMHNMNFRNTDQVLETMRWVFRDDTYQRFLLEMQKKNGLVSNVVSKKLLVTLTPLSDVRVLNQQIIDGRRVWKMEMKGMLVLSGSIEGGEVHQTINFSVLIEEVPTTQNPYGLVISQYSEQPM